MSFLKETDYHASRRCEASQSMHVALDDLRLRVSLIFAWAGMRIENLLRLVAAPLRTSSLIDHGQKHFTLLGVRPPATSARSITDIFPIPDSIERPRKGRNDN